jgi:hypothetical protein
MEGMESINHLLYIIVDQNFNISSHVGIPVNGIIGSSVFNLFEINYEKKGSFFIRITVTEKEIERKYKSSHYYRRIKTVRECYYCY